MHDYTYLYYDNTNRLKNVTGSGDRYVYDANGNVQHDLDSSIGFIIYDIYNLPVAVYTTAGVLRRYYYDHNGNRVRKYVGSYTNYINGIDGRTEVITNHTASWATYNLHGLDHIGQIRRESSTWNRFYFLKDHLGSVKVIVNASGNRVAHTDLYPFGFEMPGRVQCQSGPDCRYKFTGKERDSETSYDYFGARYYDARIGRWLQVDPLAHLAHDNTPYQYCHNDPVNRFEQDGRADLPNQPSFWVKLFLKELFKPVKSDVKSRLLYNELDYMSEIVYSPDKENYYILVIPEKGRRYYIDEKGRKYTIEGTKKGMTMAEEEAQAKQREQQEKDELQEKRGGQSPADATNTKDTYKVIPEDDKENASN